MYCALLTSLQAILRICDIIYLYILNKLFYCKQYSKTYLRLWIRNRFGLPLLWPGVNFINVLQKLQQICNDITGACCTTVFLNGDPTPLVNCLYQMSPLTHKRTTSSLAQCQISLQFARSPSQIIHNLLVGVPQIIFSSVLQGAAKFFRTKGAKSKKG